MQLAHPLTHSYSAIKDFQGCGRRYHQVRILRKFKQQDTQATLYGTEVHKAFENYIANEQPLPERFSRYHKYVEPLKHIAGEIQCEHRMGIRKDFTPCEFFDKAVWFRGVPDFLALNHERKSARVVDFKTGKNSRYADTEQLELMAAMIMAHWPEINKVHGMLLFVVANDAVPAVFTRNQLPEIFSKWAGRASQIEEALENDVWNPRQSPLCKFCPVSTAACEFKE